MEKKKIDRIIEAFRYHIQLKEEGGMVANAPGSQGGGGESSDPKGPFAGRATPINFDGRSKIARRLPPSYRTDLINKKKT